MANKTIKVILLLWENISQNFDFKFLLMRRLQQDLLENVFGHIRQKQGCGCNINPNVSQFISGLKHIGICKLFILSDKGNVEDDRADLLQEQSPFSLCVASPADVVEVVPPDNFPSLNNISEFESHKSYHVIDDPATY